MGELCQLLQRYILQLPFPIKPLAVYQNLPVPTPKMREPYLYYLNYLDRNLGLLNRMLNRHSQVLFFRMDLRFPDRILWYSEKELFSRFLDQNRKLLVSRELDPQYIVRMERKTGVYGHFHMAVLLNGNKVCHGYPFKREAEILWQKILNEFQNGLVDFCNRDWQGKPYPKEIKIVRHHSTVTSR
jgi:hypothetical protein